MGESKRRRDIMGDRYGQPGSPAVQAMRAKRSGLQALARLAIDVVQESDKAGPGDILFEHRSTEELQAVAQAVSAAKDLPDAAQDTKAELEASYALLNAIALARQDAAENEAAPDSQLWEYQSGEDYLQGSLEEVVAHAALRLSRSPAGAVTENFQARLKIACLRWGAIWARHLDEGEGTEFLIERCPPSEA